MKLQKLLEQIPYVMIQSSDKIKNVEVSTITYDSRKVEQGSLFVCIEGEENDGHTYIDDACRAGAAVLVVEKLSIGGEPMKFPEKVTVLFVKDTREALAYLSAGWFNYPAEKLKIIGVTGTKGKTTTAYMIYNMLKAAGYRTGLIGTIETIIGEEKISSPNTTPESFTIQEYFDKMVRIGCDFVVMEVSSQGVKQKRVEGIPFTVAVFTNFEKDHVGPGEHASLEEYRYYKAQLFKQCKIGIGNLDDAQCGYMFQRTTCKKYGFTCDSKKDTGKWLNVLSAREIRLIMGEQGPETIFMADGEEYHLEMPGIFNVYNALAALQTMKCLGVEFAEMSNVLSRVQVKGRMQRIAFGENIACYIDYAHNAWSLKNVLTTLRRYQINRIILVFGCGGNRAKSRRTEMGAVAGKWADLTIITSDNPRYEEPQQIIKDIVKGMERTRGDYRIIEDRKAAIAYALKEAKWGDVVLIAGKGHETYQEMKGKRCHMDDYELVHQLQMKQKDR